MSKTLATGRRLTKGVLLLVDRTTPAARVAAYISKRSKLLGAITVPLTIHSAIEKGIALKAYGEKKDHKTLILSSFELGAALLDLSDKLINLSDGLLALAHLPAKVEAVLGVVSQIGGALQIGVQTISVGINSYKMDQHRKLQNDVDLLMEHVDQEKFLLSFLQSWVGVTDGEKRIIAEKVEKVAQQKGWNAERKKEAYRISKGNLVFAKQKNIERSTTKKAARVAQEMLVSLKKDGDDFPVEKRMAIFREMRTVVQRHLVYQSLSLARSLIGGAGGVFLFIPALHPAIGTLVIAGAILAAMALDRGKYYLLQRGLVHIKG